MALNIKLKDTELTEQTDDLIRKVLYSEYTRDAVRSLIDRKDSEFIRAMNIISDGKIDHRDMISNMDAYIKRYHKVFHEFEKFKHFIQHNNDMPILAASYMVLTYIMVLDEKRALLSIAYLYSFIVRDMSIFVEILNKIDVEEGNNGSYKYD